MAEALQDRVQSFEHIYEFVVQFLIAYSFQLLGALVVLIAGVLIAGWVAKWLLRVQEKRNVDPTLRQFIASAVRLLLIGLAVVIALGNVGISITPLIAAIGGLAVGEPQEVMPKIVSEITTSLPTDRPRYLMGVGTPAGLL
jgi:small conductance mechanosensitive channel